MNTTLIKNSFSLSSLPPSSPAPQTPEKGLVTERPYNSLTKKPKKTAEKDNWRKSWDSQSEKIGDEFVANYNYLMNTHLIDHCNVGEGKSMLNIQNSLLQLSSSSSTLPPDADRISNSAASHSRSQPFHNNGLDIYLNIEHETKTLNIFMDCIDSKLPPVNFKMPWNASELSKESLVQKKSSFENIHQELESLGKRIRGKKNILESFSFTNLLPNTPVRKKRSLNPAYKSLRSLENRWQLLFLRCIEWECTIDQLLGTYSAPNTPRSNTSSGCTDDSVADSSHISVDLTCSSNSYNCSKNSESVLLNCTEPLEDVRPTLSILLDSLSLEKSPQMVRHDSENSKSLNFSQPDSIGVDFDEQDSSVFNKSDRSAPNHVIIYHKHEDTESDADYPRERQFSETSVAKSSESKTKTSDLSSHEDYNDENSWTYNLSTTAQEGSVPVAKSTSRSCSDSDGASLKCSNISDIESESPKLRIKQLVSYAELLVSSPVKRIKGDSSKSFKNGSPGKKKRQFSNDKLIRDSCDASGENTSEEDDELNATCTSDDNLVRLNVSKVKKNISSLSNSDTALDKIHNKSKRNSLSCPGTIVAACNISACGSVRRHKKKHRRARQETSGSEDDTISKDTKIQLINSSRRMSKCDSGTDGREQTGSLDKDLLSDACVLYTNNSTSEISCSPPKLNLTTEKFNEVPVFKLGESTNFFPTPSSQGETVTSGVEEQTSSLGTIPDEAWDNYQEKYNSEAYSEDLPDSELLHKTLHFGEDYGNFIDEQSDCSSFSTLLCTKEKYDSSILESDWDEDVTSLISKCRTNLKWCEAIHEKNPSRLNRHILIRFCRDILKKLRAKIYHLNENDVKEVTDIIHQYEAFELKFSEKVVSLENLVTEIEDHKELSEKINEIREEKDSVKKNIRDFISQQESLTILKRLDEMEKYCLHISTKWQRLETELSNFQKDIKLEVEMLKNKLGKSAESIEELIRKELSGIQDSDRHAIEFRPMSPFSCEGSDSGISDTEHDSERNRKLSDLRQLQKDLESIWTLEMKSRIAKELYDTEAELGILKNLRRLFVRKRMRAQSDLEVSEMQPRTQNLTAPWNICRNRKNLNQDGFMKPIGTSSPSCDVCVMSNELLLNNTSKSILKRGRVCWTFILINIVILILALIVWLFEPKCCEEMNNLNYSRSPQLRYIHGSPPV